MDLTDMTLAVEDSNSMLDEKAVTEENICFVEEKETNRKKGKYLETEM